jgi:NAD(P)H-dependent flavin oxidoreductase YrpB (nitropropane dioxygenase family)
VSEAGGLGTIGIVDPEDLRGEVAAARRLTGKPIAVNLLLPFAQAGHWEAAAEADVIVTFWGQPVRGSGQPWIHQVGSVDEAVAAHAAGADAVIAQGVEAGGHVRGSEPALELLERGRAALPPDYPVLLAGGIAEAADVRTALDAGATAAVAGTRFLLSEESRAHPEYKHRLLAGERTQLTELFGLGWAGAPHRVLPNAATERWTVGDPRGPGAVRIINRAVAPLAARMSASFAARLAARQRPDLPLFGPSPPLAGDSDAQVDASALYAGETIARIDALRPAAALTRELVP